MSQPQPDAGLDVTSAAAAEPEPLPTAGSGGMSAGTAYGAGEVAFIAISGRSRFTRSRSAVPVRAANAMPVAASVSLVRDSWDGGSPHT